MKSLSFSLFILVFLGHPFTSEAQRVVVRRSGERQVLSEGSDIREKRSSNISLALKLGLSQIVRGEYIGSIEYKLEDSFSLEGGLGLTFTSVIFLEDRFIPYHDLDGSGYSLMLGGKYYSGNDAMDDDYYQGIFLSRRVYNYGRKFTSEPEWYGSTRVTSITYNIGYCINVKDVALIDMALYGGVLVASAESATESFNGSSYKIESNTNRELGYTLGVSLQVGLYL